MADEQVVLSPADVVDAPDTTAEAPVERDQQGRYAKQDDAAGARSPLGNNYVMPRDAATSGRFGDVADHLAKAEYSKALHAGHIPPDESMDANTWLAAQKAQIANGTNAVEVPESSEESGVQDGDSERGQEILNTYNQRREAFAATHADFKQVVDALEFTEHIAPGIHNAILEDERGPELAYYLGQHPEITAKINELSPAGAVKELGRVSERLAQRGEVYDKWTQEVLGQAIPQNVIHEFSQRVNGQLTDDDRAVTRVTNVAKHVFNSILSLDRPDLLVSLIRNPAKLAHLSAMPAARAWAELDGMARGFEDESDHSTERKSAAQAPVPIKPVRKASPTSTGLSDDLPIGEWVKRREAEVRAKGQR